MRTHPLQEAGAVVWADLRADIGLSNVQLDSEPCPRTAHFIRRVEREYVGVTFTLHLNHWILGYWTNAQGMVDVWPFASFPHAAALYQWLRAQKRLLSADEIADAIPHCTTLDRKRLPTRLQMMLNRWTNTFPQSAFVDIKVKHIYAPLPINVNSPARFQNWLLHGDNWSTLFKDSMYHGGWNELEHADPLRLQPNDFIRFCDAFGFVSDDPFAVRWDAVLGPLRCCSKWNVPRAQEHIITLKHALAPCNTHEHRMNTWREAIDQSGIEHELVTIT